MRHLLLCALLITGACGANPAAAAVKYWIGGTAGIFNDNTRWSTTSGGANDTTAPGSADVATFDANGSGNVTITTDPNVGGINIQAGYTGTLSQNTGVALTIGSSGYSQAGGTFSGGDAAITINGTYSLSGGVFTATSGTTTIKSNFTISAGTFNHNSGAIVFNTGPVTVNIGATVLNNVAIQVISNDLTVTGTMDVNGDLTLWSVGSLNGGTIAVAGNVTTYDLVADGTAVILFDGGGNQLLDSQSSSALPGVAINKSGGTLTLQGTIRIDGFSGWSYTAGTVDAGTSTVVFRRDNKTVASGAMTFNNVTIDLYGAGTLTITGTMNVASNLYLQGPSFTGYTLSGGTINVAGNLTRDASFTLSGTTGITLNGTGAQTINTNGTGDLPNGTLTIDKSAGTATLATALAPTGGMNLTVNQGTLDLAGYNLTGITTLTVNNGATLRLQGGETVTATTKTFNSGSTIIYNGSGTYASLALGNTYHHLTFNGSGSWTHTAALTVVGNLTITSGTFNSGTKIIDLWGNWSNTGTYTSTTNTVSFYGNAVISGNTTFYNIYKSEFSAATLTFAAGSTTTINGLATLQGAPGQLLSLRSSVNGTRWNLNLAGTKSIDYVDVKDSDASGSAVVNKPVLPAHYTDSGNNISWFQITISGTIYSDAGVTPITTGPNVVLFVNGASAGSAAANGSGVYSITASINPGDTLLTYISGNANKGNTVTISAGTALSNLDIWNTYLIARQDNGGSLSNANLSTAKGAGAADILYSVSSNNLTVSGSNWTLYIPSSQSYAPAGDITTPNLSSAGTFNGGSGAIDINGALLISGGSYTATSGTTYISGNFTLSAGSYAHNSGSITFDNVGTKTVDIGVTDINNVTLSMTTGTNLAVTGTMNVNGNLTLTTLQSITSGTIAVSGNVLTTDTSVSGAGVILFTGAGTQTLSASGASGAVPGVSINKSGGSLTIQDTIKIDGGSDWTYTAGTVVTTGSTVEFQGADTTVNSGAMSFNNVILTLGGNSLTVTGTMDVNGNLTISSVNNINTGTIAVAGNVTTTDAAVAGSGRILFDGGGAQTLQVDGAGGTGGVPAVQINKGGGTLTIRDVISVGGFGAIEEWEHIVGAVDASASTIQFDFGTKTITPGTMAFNNIIINTGGSGLTVTTGILDVNGNLTITTTSAITGAITMAGNLNSTDTTVSGTGTITLDGTGAQSITTSGGADLPNGTLTINKASGTATLASNLTLNSAGQDLTITAGTLDLAGYNLVLTAAGDALTVSNGATLQLQGGETLTASTKTFSTGSTVIYNGGSTYASLVLDNSYSNLTFNNASGSWTHTGALTVNNLTITAGTLISGGQNITLSGNWSNAGTYTSGNNTVTFNGTNQSLTGSTTFYNITKTESTNNATDSILIFDNTATQTINGMLTLDGLDADDRINVVSDSPGTQWSLVMSASASKGTLDYLDVTDSDASGSNSAHKPMSPANSVNSGNNIAWFGYTLSGRVFEDANFAGTASDYDGGGSDKALANVDVELYVVDVPDVYSRSTTTDASGNFTFNDLPNDNYKIRVRSATIGDADTTPQGGLNACVPATCAYPLPEMTWGNGAALYGGQNASTDDTATGDNGGPGDTYVSVTMASSDISSVNFGFAYNLITNTGDDNNNDITQSKQGSLRQFIKNANAIGTAGSTTANSSQFRIPVSDANYQTAGAAHWWKISPGSALTTISDNGATIDATTQTTNIGDANSMGPEIEIYGGGAGNFSALTVSSGSNAIKGLAINGFNGAVGTGITLTGASATSNIVSGNYIGSHATGTAAVANKRGVFILGGAQSNTVGGTTAAARNLISGNSAFGIFINQANTDANVVQGNYIGTNAAGTAALGTSFTGIYIAGTAKSNIIGGTTAAERNVISGNSNVGVYIGTDVGTDSNIVQGNYIGTNAAGTAAVANGTGITLDAGVASNVIGGTAAGASNVISGNTGNGIYHNTAATNSVYGNYIGTNASAASLPNGGIGLSVPTGTVNLGNASETQSNIIGPNTGVGISLTGGTINLAGTVTVNDDVTLSSGTLSMGSATLNLSGNWTRTSATITPATSTVNLNGAADQTITTGGASFNNLTLNNTGAAGSDDIIVSGALDVNGVLTITDGDLDISTNNPAVNTAGNVTIGANGSIDVTSRTTTWIFDGSSVFTDSSSTGPQDLKDVEINGTAVQLGSSAKLKTLLLTAGTWYMNDFGYVLEVSGTGTPAGGPGTFNKGASSTVRYTGTGASVTIPTTRYHSLEFAPSASNTFNLSSNLTGANALSGNLTIGANAALDATASNYNIALAGNWSNSGSFTARSGTVTLNGSGQSISGTTSFNNLTKSVASADTLTFAASSTTTINGLATINGASGQLLSLRSSVNGTRANLNLAGTKSIDYVDVKDNDASGSSAGNKPVAPANSVNSGNTIAWFGSTFSGTVYSDAGVTPVAAGKTIRLLVNGSDAGATTTDGSGNYAITSSITINPGDAVLAYIDMGGGAEPQATTVTVSDGAGASGFNLWNGHVITRYDNGAGSLSNANMNSAKGAYVDTDILYSVSGAALTVSGSTTVLYVPTGHGYAPGGNVTTPNLSSAGTFNGGSGTLTASNAVNITAGTFTATSGTLNIAGNYTLSGGTYTHNNGTVTFNGTSGTISITPGGQSFYNLTFNDGGGSATYQLQGALTVANDLTVTDGILDTKSGSNYAVTVTRDFIQSGGRALANSSTLTVGRNFTANGSESGTGFNSASLTMTGTGTLTYSSLVSFWSDGFGSLTVGQSGNTTTLANTLAARSVLTVGSGVITGSTRNIYLRGAPNPLSLNVSSTISVGTLIFFNTATPQNIQSLTNGYDTNIRLGDSPSQVVNQTGNITLNSGKNLIIDGNGNANRAATYNTNGYDLVIGGDLTIGAGNDTTAKVLNGSNSAIAIKGNIDIKALGSGTVQPVFTSTGSTVTLNGAANQTMRSSGSAFNHLTLNNSGANGVSDNVTFLDALDINGVLTITDGDLDIASNNPTVNTAGHVTIGANGSIDVTARTANWTFDGTSTFTDSSASGPQQLNNVVLNGTSLTLGSSAKMKSFINTAGNMNLGSSGYTLELTGTGTPLSNSGTFTPGASTVKYTGSGSATNITTVPYSSLWLAPTGATTYSLTGNLTGGDALVGNLTIGANATLDTTANNYNIALAGNWSNSGSFAANSGTVTLNGINQNLTGNTTFNNFTKSVASADTLTFAASSTTTINGLATLNGAAGQLLSLRSSSTPARWNFNLAGTKSISYVDVKDSDASGSASGNKPVLPSNSIDSGNTIAWFGYSLTGRVFEDVNYSGGAGTAFQNGIDAGVANATVELYTAASSLVATTATDATGNYTFANVADGNYYVRVVSATLGDAGSPPNAGLNVAVTALPEQTYEYDGVTGNGAAGALGGNDVTLADPATAAGAGIGDTNVAITVSGANLTGVDFGFNYDLIVNENDTGQGSLRQFMTNANNIVGLNTSRFMIPAALLNGNGVATIAPATALPPITSLAGQTILDASTQTSNIGNTNVSGPEVEIVGPAGGAHGIELNTASNATIRGFIIRGFNGVSKAAIYAISGDNHSIMGNYIGTNYAGTAPSANTFGIYLRIGTGHSVGTAALADRNVIAGNTSYGIYLWGTGNSTLINNYIGVNASATAAIANGTGVYLRGSGTADNIVGGTALGEGNVIAGNSASGIRVATDTGLVNTFLGNYVGTNASAANLPNGGAGVSVNSGDLIIGDAAEVQSNIIGNAGGAGISVSETPTFEAVVSFAGTVDVNDDISLDANATINLGAATINLSGNWANLGSIVNEGTSSVNLDGINQSISGNNTFYNLTKTEATNNATDSILTFDNAATQTINGTLTLDGLDADDRINLVSDIPGTQWSLVLGAAAVKVIDYVDVQDSDASGSAAALKPIAPANSINSGNNIAWFGETFSGTVYSDAGVTPVAAGKTIRLLVNGSDAGTAITDGSGNYAITSSITINPGDAVLAYIDMGGGAEPQATTVTVSNGVGVSGFDLWNTYVLTRYDNGAGSLTNANLSSAKGAYVDSDILYSVSSGALTVSGGGTTLYVPPGHGYAPGGDITTPNLTSAGTFNGGSGVLTISGHLTQSAGSFTATSATLTVGGNVTFSAGTFTHNSGTLTLTGAAPQINTGGATLNHVTLNNGSSAGYTITGTVNIAGTLTLGAQDSSFAGGTLAVTGNVVTSAISASGTTVLMFTGAGTQTLNGGAGGRVPSLTVDKSGGVLDLQGIIGLNGSAAFTYVNNGANGVDVNAGTSLVYTSSGGSKTIDAGAVSFYDFTLSMNTSDLTVTGALDVNRNFDIQAVGNVNGGVITVAGNLSSSDAAVGGTATLTLDGTGAQTIAAGGADLPNGTLTINKASGMATLASDLTLNGAGQALTVTAGTLDLAGRSLTVPGTLSLTGNLQLQGGETTVSYGGVSFVNNATVIYNGAGAYSSLKFGSFYNNVTFNNATGSWSQTAPITVSGNLAITSGTLNSAGQNITLSGNWSNSGTYTSGANTVTLNGTGQSLAGNTGFNHFTKSVASADTLTFAAGSTTSINGTATLQGAAGQLLGLRSSTPGTRWNFQLGAGANKNIAYIDVRDSDASASAAALLPVAPSNSTDGGNNIAWFAASSITVSGTVYTDEGVTSAGAGITVRLLVNGTSAGTAVTNASGQYTLPATVAAGDALLVYLDTNGGARGVTVTVSGGAPLAGLDIYAARVITRHDNGGALSNADMSAAKGGDTDTDILYAVTGGALMVNGAATELHIPAGHIFAPGGGVTTGNMHINGTFDAAAQTVNVSGDWDATGGTFVSAGTVLFNASSGARTLITGGNDANHDFQNLVFSGGALWTLQGALHAGTLNLAGGVFDINGNALSAAGAFDNTGTLRLQGGETVTLAMDTNSGTVDYNGAGSYTGLAAGNNYNHVTFTGPGTWTQNAALHANGDIVLAGGTLASNGYGITLGGDWSNTALYISGANTVTFNGANQNLSGSTTFHHLTKSVTSAGTLTFAAGSTTSINGTATLQGAAGQLLGLRSSTPGTRWNFQLGAGANKTIAYVDVRDSDASASAAALLPVAPSNSTDGGNNVGWFAAAAAFSSAMAEISPNVLVTGSSANALTLHLHVAVQGADTGVDTVTLTAPAGYSSLSVTGVSAAGVALAPACPSPAANGYCATVAGQTVTLTFGARITATSLITVSLNVTAPAVAGMGAFTVSADDSATSVPAQNAATGDADGDGGGASLSIEVAAQAVSSLLAEAVPDTLTAGQTARALAVDVLPTLVAGDSGFDRLTLTLPGGYGNPAVTGLTAGGVALTAHCPAAASEFCATVTGQMLTLDLGGKVTASLTPVRIALTVDTPAATGVADLLVTVDDTATVIPPQAASAGDANGDAADANTLTLTVTAGADAALSTLGVEPPIVLADGVAAATATVTLRDSARRLLPGKIVTVASQRGAVDTVTQPPAATDTSGVATAAIRSATPGVVTLTATDVTDNIILAQQAQFYFTQGQVLEITKRASKQEAVVGDVVTYTVEIKNTTAREVVQVHLQDTMPPNFKYLDGSARLNGAMLADPAGNRPRVFDIGTVAALADGNGNGTADPGEPGYLKLSYQTVVGAGATPGDYLNTAVARDVCAQCLISNQASASVEVTLDPLFDLGTLLGKVFEDRDSDGVQDEGEPGVPGVMVALDDGTYALTDTHGRYHFPALKPGERLLKINTGTLPGGATLTTDESRVASLTPGLLAKVNFGIVYKGHSVRIGDPGQTGVRLDSMRVEAPLELIGNAAAMALLVNGGEVNLPRADAWLETGGVPSEVIDFAGAELTQPARFQLQVSRPEAVQAWHLQIMRPGGATVKHFEGAGPPPATVDWDGRDDGGKPLTAGGMYHYQMSAVHQDGGGVRGARRLLGVDSTASFSVNLTGSAFAPGSFELSDAAKLALKRAADTLRIFPREKIAIEGHADSIGGDELNLALSQKRAEAALRYLIDEEGIPAERLETHWYGSSRPTTRNDTPEHRLLNRRVEVKGVVSDVVRASLLDNYRGRPLVKVDGETIALDRFGRFSALLPGGKERMGITVEMQDGEGRELRTSLAVPRLELPSLQDSRLLADGEEGAGYRMNVPPPGGWKWNDEIGEYTLQAQTSPGGTVELDGASVAVMEDGRFSLPLKLKPGGMRHDLIVRDASGAARIATLHLTLIDRGGDGDPLWLRHPIPPLSVNLPPPGMALTSPLYTINGQTEPGNQVRVNDVPVAVDPEGRFTSALELKKGVNPVRITVLDPAGFIGTLDHDIDIRDTKVFFLALADGKFSQLKGKGYLAGAGMKKSEEFRSEGRLAYYLKGTVAGKYLVTSAFDSGTHEVGQLFRDFNTEDTRRLLANLDPDTLYPVYGDSSTLVYDAQSQGKFYLAVDSDTLHALVGNYPLSLTDTDLAAYQRTLYGVKVDYRSAEQTVYDKPNTGITVFSSEVRQVHVRDEVRATGGSLYYLSHDQSIEGSEQITVVIRDKNTGLTLSRAPLRQNLDYTIDYQQGRVLLAQPLASVSDDSRLIDAAPLGGNPVFLQIDYEYRAGAFEQGAAGVRARQQFGDRIALGATYIDDTQSQNNYELRGIDGELRLSRHSRITAELAESDGTDGFNYFSDDGGLTYSSVTRGAQSGQAWKVAMELDLGEWFDDPDRYKLSLYYKRLEEGFAANGNFLDAGAEKRGIALTLKMTPRDTLTLRHDEDNTRNGMADSMYTALQWQHRWTRTALTGEYQASDTSEGAQSLLAAKVETKITRALSASLEHQSTLSGAANDRTRIGAAYQITPALSLQAKAAEGDKGQAAQLGLSYGKNGHRTYLTGQISEDQAGATRSNTVAGTEAPLERGRIYSEYQWEREASDTRQVSVIGAQRGWEMREGLNLTLSGEHGDISAESGDGSRYTVAAGLSYKNLRGWKGALRNELRRELGARDRIQFLTREDMEIGIHPDYTVLGKYYFSRTTDRALDVIEAELEERSLGLAYRPVTNDRFNGLARYTYLTDRRPAGLGEGAGTFSRMEVFSVEGIWTAMKKLEWVEKAAMRAKFERAADQPGATTHTYLFIHRLNYTLGGDFKAGAEYRTLTQQQADDQRKGWLAELMWEPLQRLRLGAGYNFTDFSDNEFSDNDYSVRGWFVRAQGKF